MNQTVSGNRRGQLFMSAGTLCLAICFGGWNLFISPFRLSAQEPATASQTDEVLARVAETPIRAVRVDAYLKETVPGWPVAEALQPPLRDAALEHLIKRELVFAWLDQNEFGATAPQIEWRLDELKTGLQRVGKSLEDHLQSRNLKPEELRRELAWEIAWRRYLEQTLTEERLTERFHSEPRDFDGTQLRVAQILLERTNEQSDERSMQDAERLRQQLLRGELTWEAAVRSHSIAASREKGGELGWIRRSEPMPEDFSKVAFQLKEGEIAAPLASRFGIHLIKCLEVKPGSRQFGDARERVRRAVMEEEFERLAELMRAKLPVSVAPGK